MSTVAIDSAVDESVILHSEPNINTGVASIVVPIRLWRRIRSLLAMHTRISAELSMLETEGGHEHSRKPVRTALIRDIAKADGNETQHMDTGTIESMYGNIADTILTRYNVNPKRERNTNV